MMFVLIIPLVFFSRRFGKQIESLRRAEGRYTAKPLVETRSQESRGWKTQAAFCAGGLLTIAGPAILSLVAGDWRMLVTLLALVLLVGCICAQLSRRFPRLTFQFFCSGIGINVLAAIGIMVWKNHEWSLAFSNYLLWYSGALQASAMTMAILTTLAWKRLHGRRQP
jgi:hypothetical protein